MKRAQSYLENGQYQAYLSQKQAFILQVQGFAPQFITQEVADILSTEAGFLLNSNH